MSLIGKYQTTINSGTATVDFEMDSNCMFKKITVSGINTLEVKLPTGQSPSGILIPKQAIYTCVGTSFVVEFYQISDSGTTNKPKVNIEF